MTHEQLAYYIKRAPHYQSRDAYMSAMVLSPMWERGGCPDPLPNEDSLALIGLYEVTHLTLREIRKRLHLTKAQLSQRTLIPVSTLKKWESGIHPCPPYVWIHILNSCGLLPVCHDNFEETKRKRK